MDCQHATHLLSRSLDGRISRRQRWGLRLHLMMCHACTQFSRQLLLLREAVKRLGGRIENDQALVLSQEARNRIVAAMENQQRSLDVARQNPDQNFTD